MNSTVHSNADAFPFLDVEATPDSIAAMRPDTLFCITAYNEGAEAVTSTLASVCKSLREARRGGLRRAGDTGLCLIVDGREKMNRELLTFLLSAGLVTPSALLEDQRTRFFFARCTARELPWPHGQCDDDEEISFVVCIKGRNRGKLHSHALFFGHLCVRLRPRLCFQIDCGTTVEATAVGAMLAQFEREPTTAALASCVSTPAPESADGLIGSWQFMDFATQAAVYWHAELESGHLSVIPGQFSALRWRALSGCPRVPFTDERALLAASTAGDDDPLGRYLRGLAKQRPLEQVMFLAEDRVVGNELVLGRQEWTLGYCPEAQATTDACATLPELLRQRRRWNNGSTAARLWLAIQWAAFMRRTDRDPASKLRFTSALIWQALLVFQQCAAPATFVCLLLVVARAVGAALERNALGGPAVLAMSLAVGLTVVAWRRKGAQWRNTLRDGAFVVAQVGLAVLLSETLPMASLAVLMLFPVAAALVTAGSCAPRSAPVLRRAAEYMLVNPVMQVILWAYSIARLPDTSWGTKGLTQVAKPRPAMGVAALGLWAAANALLVGVALAVPPLVLQGLDPVLEFGLLMSALPVAAALLRRGADARQLRLRKVHTGLEPVSSAP